MRLVHVNRQRDQREAEEREAAAAAAQAMQATVPDFEAWESLLSSIRTEPMLVTGGGCLDLSSRKV